MKKAINSMEKGIGLLPDTHFNCFLGEKLNVKTTETHFPKGEHTVWAKLKQQ
jgi:hypothetical protein